MRQRSREKRKEKEQQWERQNLNRKRQGKSREYHQDNYPSREERSDNHRRYDHSQKYQKKISKEPRDIREEKQPLKTITAKVNRKQQCPFLVRIFYAINTENQFKESEGKLPEKEIQLHFWFDTNLKEITELLRAHLPVIRTKQRFIFWRVFPKENTNQQADIAPEYIKKELGTVLMHRFHEKVEEKTLMDYHFSIGDYLDVSINYK